MLARSPYLIFFTCFQLRLAVPIPKILDRTKQASFPSTLVLGSVQVWCQRQATTKSHSSLLCTTLCHCSECLSGSQTFGAHQKNIVVISARHSLCSVEVKFSGTSSFPIKRLTASEYIGLSSIHFFCIIHYSRMWWEYISYQTIIMNELGSTFEPECHDLVSHQILQFVIVQSIF